MCNDVCSEYCVDFMLCDYVNGSCEIGCQDGFLGLKCIDCKQLQL